MEEMIIEGIVSDFKGIEDFIKDKPNDEPCIIAASNFASYIYHGVFKGTSLEDELRPRAEQLQQRIVELVGQERIEEILTLSLEEVEKTMKKSADSNGEKFGLCGIMWWLSDYVKFSEGEELKQRFTLSAHNFAVFVRNARTGDPIDK